jgi:hypothetical protein
MTNVANGAIKPVATYGWVACAGPLRTLIVHRKTALGMRVHRFPLALVVIGAVGAAAAQWLPSAEWRPVYQSVDLRKGATTTVEFRAERTVQHEIGIEMDLAAAEELFPCTAGRDYPGPIDQCEGARIPISLQVALFENDIDRSDSVSPSTSVAGGSYVFAGEHPTFTWPVAYADLSSGARYRMVIQSLTDGTAALPANPRLTVEVSPIDTMGESIIRYFGFWLAVAVAAVGGIWMLIAYALAMRRRP